MAQSEEVQWFSGPLQTQVTGPQKTQRSDESNPTKLEETALSS